MQDYIQSDPRWGSVMLSPHMDMAEGGCGATAVADCVSYNGNNPEILPPDVGIYLAAIGMIVDDQGTIWSGIKAAADHYNCPCEPLNGGSLYGITGSTAEQVWLQKMKTGNYYGILCMGAGFFAYKGHYIAVEAVDAYNRVTVHDPAYRPRSGRYGWAEIVPAGAPGACYSGVPYFSGRVKIFYLVEKIRKAETSFRFTLDQIQIGQSGATVEFWQRMLVSRGLLKIADVDGDFGDKTKNATIRFQGILGLKQDGIVGVKTWTAMIPLPYEITETRITFIAPEIAFGYYGGAAYFWQGLLKGWGYYTGVVDFTFGDGCRIATLKFQQAKGLTQDAIVGKATWSKAIR